MSSAGLEGIVARARRFWQVHPGDPNVFSTAGSFSPPVGSRIADDGTGGYYIDFTVKADEPSWPPSWLEGGDRQLHVATAQWGLGCFERYLAGDGEEWLAAAIGAADHLVADQADDGGWLHGIAMPHTYRLQPPWVSAMAQGEGASLLVRVHRSDRARTATPRRRCRPARRCGSPASHGGDRGGARRRTVPRGVPDRTRPRSCSTGRSSRSGAVATSRSRSATPARPRSRRGGARHPRGEHPPLRHRVLVALRPLPHPIPNVASGAYHRLHINQLRAMQVTDAATAVLRPRSSGFEGYERSRPPARRALSAEGRRSGSLVPRNERLAHRLPWSHRPEHGEVLVLCYHAVSDEWPSRLAVTTGTSCGLSSSASRPRLRRRRPSPTRHAAERRTTRASRSPSTTATPSLEPNAVPILAELGMPGTVFVPDRRSSAAPSR